MVKESCHDSKWWRGEETGNRSLYSKLQRSAIRHLVNYSQARQSKIVPSRLATTKMDSDQIADLDFQTKQITAAISTHICLNSSMHPWFIGIGEKILSKQSAMTTKNKGQKAAHDTTNLT